MVKSMFTGITGLRAHQTKMDVIGNNIANVNTYGFKAGTVSFKDAFYQTVTTSSAAGLTTGGTNASQVGYGTSVGSIGVLHTTAGFAPTDNPSDLMVNGEGYFILGPITGNMSADSANSALLTRVGNFVFDVDGYLVNPDGQAVYGFEANYSTTGNTTFDMDDLEPIRLPKNGDIFTTGEMAGTTPLDKNDTIKPTSISFGANGEITATVKDADGNSKVVTIGKVAIANVPNANGLEMAGNSTYKAGANAGTVTAFQPGEGPTGQIRSGGLEMSNVDLSKEFADMITTQRGFQANTKIITVSDEMLQELVSMKR